MLALLSVLILWTRFHIYFALHTHTHTLSLLALGDVIPCDCIQKIKGKDVKNRRFLVVDNWRVMLLDTDKRNLSNGIVKFVADLKSIRCVRDKKDAKKVTLSVYERSKFASPSDPPQEVYSIMCIFDDTIRSLTATQYIGTGKEELLHRKQSALQKALTQLASITQLQMAS
eukprot:m.110095 g.110095  ORF g.110095 m.110095 type:complete len:171 (-) comp9216_c1_seq3:208-720(-)